MNIPQVDRVYLGLGSNLGNRELNLEKALDFLSERMKVVKVSSIYDTEPVGNPNQPRFLNLVCEVQTGLSPLGLLIVVKAIENKLGRMPSEPNAPRTVDIDILLYGDKVTDTPQLTIPHPRLHERAFVLVPLSEIASDIVHPVIKKTVKELSETVEGEKGVVLHRKAK